MRFSARLPVLTLLLVLGLAACDDRGPVAPTSPDAVPISQSVVPDGVEACGDPLEADLLAGQDIDIGSVTVANDEDHLYVTYATEDGWTLQATHLETATALAEVPTNSSGNPLVGHFSRQDTHDGVTRVTYTIPLSELGAVIGDGLVVAAHADVRHDVDDRRETAWADGTRFVEEDGSWATYAGYTVQECIVVLAPNELCADHADDAIATFADPNLEAAVRRALETAETVPLTCGELKVLKRLIANNLGIENLAGLQNLVSLEQLGLHTNLITDIGPIAPLTALRGLLLQNNQITDVGPLAGLTELQVTALSNNQIIDVSPLSGLTKLFGLNLDVNRIPDVSPLAPLTGLRVLTLNTNQLSDVNPLSDMTELRFLALGFNSLTDISPLSGLNEIEILNLTENDITDIAPLEPMVKLRNAELSANSDLANIQPLLNNTGLGSGDEVDLRATAVICDDVAALEAKGVTVETDCP